MPTTDYTPVVEALQAAVTAIDTWLDTKPTVSSIQLMEIAQTVDRMDALRARLEETT